MLFLLLIKMTFHKIRELIIISTLYIYINIMYIKNTKLYIFLLLCSPAKISSENRSVIYVDSNLGKM